MAGLSNFCKIALNITNLQIIYFYVLVKIK